MRETGIIHGRMCGKCLSDIPTGGCKCSRYDDGSGILAWQGINELPSWRGIPLTADGTLRNDRIISVDWGAYQPATATDVMIEEANKRAKHVAVYNGRGVGKTAAMKAATQALGFGMGRKKLNEYIYGDGSDTQGFYGPSTVKDVLEMQQEIDKICNKLHQ